jgi:glycogen debranching enzyme
VAGFFHQDTRLLSTCVLTIDGRRPVRLSVGQAEFPSASFFLTTAEAEDGRAGGVSIIRRRTIEGDRLLDHLTLQSYLTRPMRLRLSLAFDADFADVFEVKGGTVSVPATVTVRSDEGRRLLRFDCRAERFTASTVVLFTAPPAFDGATAHFDVELPPRGEWSLGVLVRRAEDDSERQPSRPVVVVGAHQERAEGWRAAFPELLGGPDGLRHTYRGSVADIDALRLPLRVRGGREVTLPAAGMPWFMTIFGRDTLLTAYELLPFDPDLAAGALEALVALQGERVDGFRDEEPGKILHEIRFGKLTVVGAIPHDRYYGTVDATPLWLILLSEHRRLSGRDDLCIRLRDHALRALAWIDRFGDLDGDGFVEYRTRSTQGLANQGWKDSGDGIQFADGRIAAAPIALCEVQGYVFDAKVRLAEIAEQVWRDPVLATRLRDEAAVLFDRFNEAYWMPERGGYYAVGLDGDKRAIDGMTSNMGHLLWSGIVPEDRAGRVADVLFTPAMHSGWGIRTVSSQDAGYNPIAYHTGSVWPHDNALIAMGLFRYGFRPHAGILALGLLEAAAYTGGRLAEVFAGFPRSETGFPVRCPTAASPQAWAAGAPFLMLRALLGLDVRDGDLACEPVLPPEMGSIALRGLPILGARFDVEAEGTRGSIRSSG